MTYHAQHPILSSAIKPAPPPYRHIRDTIPARKKILEDWCRIRGFSSTRKKVSKIIARATSSDATRRHISTPRFHRTRCGSRAGRGGADRRPALPLLRARSTHRPRLPDKSDTSWRVTRRSRHSGVNYCPLSIFEHQPLSNDVYGGLPRKDTLR